MSKNNFVALNRDQFAILLEAKRLVSQEFKQTLSLQDQDILSKLKVYSDRSSNDRLTKIYQQLETKLAIRETTGVDLATKNPNPQSTSYRQQNVSKSSDQIQVGDIIDGKQVAGLYRGQPVFSQSDSKPSVETSSEPQITKQAGDSVQLGDIVEGKRVTGFYRGQPVFK